MAAVQLYVRKTGSAAAGGSSSGAIQRTAADGVTNGTTTFTAALGAFTGADVDKLINIVGKGRYRITAVTAGTIVTLSGSPSAGTGLTWNLGGACLNVGDLLQAAAGTIANGDSIWIGAGTYRETLVVTNTNTAEVTVNGDVDGAKTGDVGMVQVTAYTTNDKTAPSATTLLNLSGKDFLTFKNIMFVNGGATNLVLATTTTSTDIKFTDCAFVSGKQLGGTNMISAANAFGVAMNWTFSRCHFLAGSAGNTILFSVPTGVGADYDLNVLFDNCVLTMLQGSGSGTVWIVPTGTGAGANKGGGIRARNCSFFGGGAINTLGAGLLSTSIPCTINNCLIVSAGTSALVAATSGQVTEDYNLIYTSAAARSNVTAGTHSISDGTYAPLWHFGQERIWGGLVRQFGEPMAGSPLLGFGNDGNQASTDLRGAGHIRPAGGASALPAAGAMERGNTFSADPSPIGTGATPIKCTGPAYAMFYVPVPARAITISVKVKWDATYAGTKPQLYLYANGVIGVTTQTVTAVGSSGSVETLTLAAFTPSAGGNMVTVEVISNDTNGSGVLQVDDFTVSG